MVRACDVIAHPLWLSSGQLEKLGSQRKPCHYVLASNVGNELGLGVKNGFETGMQCARQYDHQPCLFPLNLCHTVLSVHDDAHQNR